MSIIVVYCAPCHFAFTGCVPVPVCFRCRSLSGFNPSITSPGAYRQICIELTIGDLAVNTVLNSAYIDEIEGLDTALADVSVSGS